MLELTPSQIRAKIGMFPVRFRQDPKMTYYLDNAPNDIIINNIEIIILMIISLITN